MRPRTTCWTKVVCVALRRRYEIRGAYFFLCLFFSHLLIQRKRCRSRPSCAWAELETQDEEEEEKENRTTTTPLLVGGIGTLQTQKQGAFLSLSLSLFSRQTDLVRSSSRGPRVYSQPAVTFVVRVVSYFQSFFPFPAPASQGSPSCPPHPAVTWPGTAAQAVAYTQGPPDPLTRRPPATSPSSL